MPKTTKKSKPQIAVAQVVTDKTPASKEVGAVELLSKCKSAMMYMMLARPEGATLAELSKALGWQERSIRGSMSNMLKKGIIKKIYSKKLDDDRTYFAEV